MYYQVINTVLEMEPGVSFDKLCHLAVDIAAKYFRLSAIVRGNKWIPVEFHVERYTTIKYTPM